ncbi:MAG TPA: glycosyl hydrolase family 88 [Lachnospiraceae bacterium]|nr:glycosyl hydrolase family 88 [Lachnospiraceae bacterium]
MDKEKTDQYLKQYLDKYQPYQTYWNYEDGCLLMGCRRMYEATGDAAYKEFILKYLDARVEPDGSIPTYNRDHDALDDLNCGKLLFFGLDETGKTRYLKALEYHMERLHAHPRCRCGSFWHKDIYPDQIWLDGLYMAQPLYMEYETRFNGMENYNDIMNQFRNVRRYMYSEEKGLYYHGFDEARIQPWADRQTGCSENFWSRACGWWLMALVDTMEVMNPQIYEHYRELQDLFREAVHGLLPYRDREDGLIHQVIDRADVKGNYTETSGSVMAAAALMKGVRQGTLNPEKYLPAGREMFESVCENKLRESADGVTRLQDICHVGGLGPGEKRDGSVGYYLSEPISADDAKGVGPFMMAYAEYLRS